MSASNRSTTNHRSTVVEQSHRKSAYQPRSDNNNSLLPTNKTSERRYTAFSSNVKTSSNPADMDKNRRRMTALPESGTFKSFGKNSAKPSFLKELEAKRGTNPGGVTHSTIIERKTETKRSSGAVPDYTPSKIGNSMKLDLSGINRSVPDRNWAPKSSTIKKSTTETSSFRRGSMMPGNHSTIKKSETVTRTSGRGAVGYPSGIGMSNPSLMTNLTFNNKDRSAGVFNMDGYEPVTGMRYGKIPNRSDAKSKYSQRNPYPHAEDMKLIEEVNRRRGKEFQKNSYERTPATKKGGFGGLSTASGANKSPNYYREEANVSKFDNGRRYEESKVIQRETY